MNFRASVEHLLTIEDLTHPVIMAYKELRDKTPDEEWDKFHDSDLMSTLFDSLGDLEYTLTEEDN